MRRLLIVLQALSYLLDTCKAERERGYADQYDIAWCQAGSAIKNLDRFFPNPRHDIHRPGEPPRNS
jgi:hypothetical protein